MKKTVRNDVEHEILSKEFFFFPVFWVLYINAFVFLGGGGNVTTFSGQNPEVCYSKLMDRCMASDRVDERGY